MKLIWTTGLIPHDRRTGSACSTNPELIRSGCPHTTNMMLPSRLAALIPILPSAETMNLTEIPSCRELGVRSRSQVKLTPSTLYDALVPHLILTQLNMLRRR